MNPISSDIFGRLSWLTKAFKNLCCKVGLLDDRVTFIEDTCCNGGGRDAPLLIEKTLSQIETIIGENSLVPGAVYKITGVWKGHYNDGTNPGTTIYLHALTTSELSKEGWGEFYNPIYQSEDDYYNEDPTGLWGIWDENNYNGNYSYQIDDVVIWGSFKWINISGSTGYAIDSQTLQSGDWAKIPYTDTDHYIKVIDYIEYDLFWDYIRRRKSIDSDNSGEERHIDVYESQSPAISAIESVAWGLRMVKNININATGTGFNIINFKGINLENITINNGFLAINYSNYDSRIFRINLDQSFIDINLGTDSILSDINLTNASDISGCYLGQSCNFSSLKLDGFSSIRNIEGEYFGLISLTLNNYSKIGIDQNGYDNGLNIYYSDFTNITMSDYCTISNSNIYSSYIRDCQLINHSYFDNFDIYSDSFITNVSLESLSYLSNIYLSEYDYFDQLSLKKGSYLNNVLLYTYCSIGNCYLEENSYISNTEFYSGSYISNIEISHYSNINDLYLNSSNFLIQFKINQSSSIYNVSFGEGAYAIGVEIKENSDIHNMVFDLGSTFTHITISNGSTLNNSYFGASGTCNTRFFTINNNSQLYSIVLNVTSTFEYITVTNNSTINNINEANYLGLYNITVNDSSYVQNIITPNDGNQKYLFDIKVDKDSYINSITLENNSYIEWMTINNYSHISNIDLIDNCYITKVTLDNQSVFNSLHLENYASIEHVNLSNISAIGNLDIGNTTFSKIQLTNGSSLSNISGGGESFYDIVLQNESYLGDIIFDGYGMNNIFLNSSSFGTNILDAGTISYLRMNAAYFILNNIQSDIIYLTFNDVGDTLDVSLSSEIYKYCTKTAYLDFSYGNRLSYMDTDALVISDIDS